MKELNEEKLLDLLCKKAVSGLNESETEELKRLETEFPDLADDDSFELAAAAINLSAIDSNEKMPAHLRTAISAQAAEFFEPNEELQKTFAFEPKRSFWQSLGWGVAALACLLLAVNVYLTRFQVPANEVLANSQKREILLAESSDLIKAEVSKADPKSPVEITGDVVWSSEKQTGYLRFRGLPVNDPERSTYQLWIFDEAQDEKYPVDGGVFDINQDGEVIIPIDAKINVKNPKLFAVTKEKPGGVVVSDRTGIIAVAKV